MLQRGHANLTAMPGSSEEETAHSVANNIPVMLRANGVQGPTPTRDIPCSLEYLIENALRKLGRDLHRERLEVNCAGEPFPRFIYPET
jgi:hypothetical protein